MQLESSESNKSTEKQVVLEKQVFLADDGDERASPVAPHTSDLAAFSIEPVSSGTIDPKDMAVVSAAFTPAINADIGGMLKVLIDMDGDLVCVHQMEMLGLGRTSPSIDVAPSLLFDRLKALPVGCFGWPAHSRQQTPTGALRPSRIPPLQHRPALGA